MAAQERIHYACGVQKRERLRQWSHDRQLSFQAYEVPQQLQLLQRATTSLMEYWCQDGPFLASSGAGASSTSIVSSARDRLLESVPRLVSLLSALSRDPRSMASAWQPLRLALLLAMVWRRAIYSIEAYNRSVGGGAVCWHVWCYEMCMYVYVPCTEERIFAAQSLASRLH